MSALPPLAELLFHLRVAEDAPEKGESVEAWASSRGAKRAELSVAEEIDAAKVAGQ